MRNRFAKNTLVVMVSSLVAIGYPLLATADSHTAKPDEVNVQQQALNPQEEYAYTLGVQALIYGTGPLAVAAVRKTATSVSVPMDNGLAPLNQMGKTYTLAGPDDKLLPTVNNDTIYSQSHIDLVKSGPMVLQIPPTGKRYFIVQLLDAYSEAIDNLIADNVGSKGSKVLLVQKGWKGELPKGIDKVVSSPTRFVWYIERTAVAGKKDMAAADKVHVGFINYPLKEYGKPHKAAKLKHAVGIPATVIPKGLTIFAALDHVLRQNPLPQDASIVDQFKYIGIGLKKPFNAADLTEAQRKGLARAAQAAPQIVAWASRHIGVKNNGWSMMFKGGKYGTDYLSRATINYRAVGLNTPDRALYPNRYTDAKGQTLNGQYQYRVTMPADMPAKAFWSLTMYDAKHLFMVPNAIDRYSISSLRKDEYQYNKNGSLTICMQYKKPTDKSCNWLPTPKGDFYLHMRLYEPTKVILDNNYSLPQVNKH